MIPRGAGGSNIGTNYLEILSDPEYMAGVREKLKLIANYEIALAANV